MILLIFEGGKEEPKIMATVKELFFPNEEQVHRSYGHDTASLYADIKKHQENPYEEPDIFTIVKESLQRRNDHSLDSYKSYQFDSIYLFFDYDPQNDLGLEEVNERVSSVIHLFSEAEDNGQVFISYPMVEALYCVNTFPDATFENTTVALKDCRSFKLWCREFRVGSNKELVLFKTRKNEDGNYFIVDKDKTQERKEQLEKVWFDLIKENVKKANIICNGINSTDVETNEISQQLIFENEIRDYVLAKDEVAIISAFTLFLYEYFHGNGYF